MTRVDMAFVDYGGKIDAQTGTIDFAGGNATFYGTTFTGAGVNRISNDAAFGNPGVGAATTNLELAGGTFSNVSGQAATLNGPVKWTGGQFGGAWQNKSVLTVWAGGQTGLAGSASFTNQGTVDLLSGADIKLAGSSNFTNAGGSNSPAVLKIEDDGTILSASGGQIGYFYNYSTGILRKVGGTGTTTIGGQAFYDTGGIIDAQTGTIDFAGGNATFFGTTFTGAGVNRISNDAAFGNAGVGAATTNLELAAGTFSNLNGSTANLNGQVYWSGGQFNGSWNNQGTLTVMPSVNTSLASGTSFSNYGTINGNGTIGTQGASFQNYGVIAPGNSPGKLTIDGNYTQGSNGLLKIELSSASLFDQLFVTGNASLSGNLELDCLSCALAVGDVFDIMHIGGNMSGSFLTTILLGFDPAYTFNIGFAADKTLKVTVLTAPVPIPPALLLFFSSLSVLAFGALKRKGVSEETTHSL